MTTRFSLLVRMTRLSSSGLCCCVALLILLGCSKKSGSTPFREEPSRRGDRVVVEQTAAEFFEGRVLDVLSGSLKLQRSDSGEVIQVGRVDVYRLGAKGKAPAPTAFAICELTPQRWEGCQVIRGDDDERVVVDSAGVEHRLTAAQLLEPTGLSTMNIRRRFDEAGRRRAFDLSISSAGMPRHIPGWTPAPHRMVLAERNGRWYGAQITEVDDERVVVRWDGQKDVSDLPKNAVVPQPPGCGIPVRGDRALRRPAGHGAPWTPVFVIGVDGAEMTIEDIERTRMVVDLRELCPLGEAKVTTESSARPSST